ncbi:MAG: DUF1015 domain-containing protein [Candidatus Coatesbacteria bacterium]|nr:MAG: DUF1015 domain-containing protein [Candidatus Coatesbacteria bacterium]
MVTVRPFKGLRPKKEYAAQVASPPYDVVNSEEAEKLAAGNDLSFLHVVKPEIDLEPGIDPYDDKVYAEAVENFKRLINDEILVQDDAENLYFYKLTFEGRSQLGLVCCCSADDYDAGTILKHELTREDKELDRSRHVSALDANAGPVFFLYRARERLDELAAEATAGPPEYDFVSYDGVRNEFWVVEDKELIDAIVAEFAGMRNVYVADGHHRTASGAVVRTWRRDANPGHTGDEEYNFFLTVLFPHDKLNIMDYNRVVQDLNDLSSDEFVEAIEGKFEVLPHDGEVPYKPEALHHFGMYLDGKWYRVIAKPRTFDEDDPVGSLDSAILQNNLIAPILGIEDLRTDKRIDFVGGVRGLEELEKRCDEEGYAVAFAVHPMSVEQLMAVADAGKILPPKSTWFEPKLKSGLIVHMLS